jgi:hypothetical protein
VRQHGGSVTLTRTEELLDRRRVGLTRGLFWIARRFQLLGLEAQGVLQVKLPSLARLSTK